MYDIEEIQLVAEMSVMDALIDSYTKQALMMSYASDGFIQEGAKWDSLKSEVKDEMDKLKGANIFKKIILFIPSLLKAIVKWIRKLIQTAKDKKVINDIDQAAKIVDELSDEELEELQKYADEVAKYKYHRYKPQGIYNGNDRSILLELDQKSYFTVDVDDFVNSRSGIVIPDMDKYKECLKEELDASKLILQACDDIGDSSVGATRSVEYNEFFDKINNAASIVTKLKTVHDLKKHDDYNDDWTDSLKQIKIFIKELSRLERTENEIINNYNQIINYFEPDGRLTKVLLTLELSTDARDNELRKMVKMLKNHAHFVIDRNMRYFHTIDYWHYQAKRINAFYERNKKRKFTIHERMKNPEKEQG